MDFTKGVLFDPGYSKYTLAFAPNIDAVYNILFSMKTMHQRKFKFQSVYPQLLKLLEHTSAFYLGCLLWATYIKESFKDEPKEILDNDYLGRSIDEDKMLYEINYAISYFEKLKKDCKYYLGKSCNLPEDWQEVITVYKDFLVSNEFLVNAKMTSDIKLPSTLKAVSKEDLAKILESIESVTTSGELKELFKIKPLIFSEN